MQWRTTLVPSPPRWSSPWTGTTRCCQAHSRASPLGSASQRVGPSSSWRASVCAACRLATGSPPPRRLNVCSRSTPWAWTDPLWISSAGDRISAWATGRIGLGSPTRRKRPFPRTNGPPTPSPPWCWPPTHFPTPRPPPDSSVARGCPPRSTWPNHTAATPRQVAPRPTPPAADRGASLRRAPPPQHSETAACSVVHELSRVQGRAVQLVGWPAAVGGVGEDVVNGQPAANRNVRRPASKVRPRRLLAVAAVDEAERQRTVPARGHGGGVTHDADDRGLECRLGDRVSPVGQRVDPPDIGIHQIGFVVVPSGLVLLGASVMVDGEHDRPCGLCCSAEIHRRLPTPGADFHEGG